MTEVPTPQVQEPCETSSPQKVFIDIDPEQPVTEIESLCMNCEKNGITKLLLTKIPHFRDVIIMAFECPHCGTKNNEVQSADSVAENGIIVTLKATGKKDLNRQIVRSDSASVEFVELTLEMPPNKGSLTTVEGLIDHAIEDLSVGQEDRRASCPEAFEKIQSILKELENYLSGETPFTFRLKDPAGNSYIENICAPFPDPQIRVHKYERTTEECVMLGLSVPEDNTAGKGGNQFINPKEWVEKYVQGELHENVNSEVLKFPSNCSSCNVPGETRMHLVDIPHFKEVVIMSTTCDACGYRNNEVKAGGAISPQAKRITLKIEDAEDLSRDILKSETCTLKIPEIDLELSAGTLGGRFTTVEGLIAQVREELSSNRRMFASGDSVSEERKGAFQIFLAKIDQLIALEVKPWTLILDDPIANSYVQNYYAPDPDPNMTIEIYDRTFDQNEELGLNDIKVDNY